jgi:hypothetical protein
LGLTKSLVIVLGFSLAAFAAPPDSPSANPCSASPSSPKALRDVISLSAKGHWTLLGSNWLVSDGKLKDLKFPPQSLHPSPLSLGFFEGKDN